jgi:hypothetical protein
MRWDVLLVPLSWLDPLAFGSAVFVPPDVDVPPEEESPDDEDPPPDPQPVKNNAGAATINNETTNPAIAFLMKHFS